MFFSDMGHVLGRAVLVANQKFDDCFLAQPPRKGGIRHGRTVVPVALVFL